MPPVRPKLIDFLTRIPKIGGQARYAHDIWLRHRINSYWQNRNELSRNIFEANIPSLDTIQQKVVNELTECGVATVSFDKLISNRQLWDKLVLEVNQWLGSEKIKEKERQYIQSNHHEDKWKEYIIMMTAEEGDMFSIDSPLLTLCLHPAILNIVNTYFGMMARLFYLDVWKTVPLSNQRPLTGSQRWHRDPEDVKLLKVFLYLTDVDETAGPLHYIKYSRRGEKHGNLWPQKLPYGSVAPANEVEERVPRKDWVICDATAGTFVFVDTTGLHMGGHAVKENRVFATWGFTSRGSVWPRYFNLAAPVDHLELPLAARYALSD